MGQKIILKHSSGATTPTLDYGELAIKYLNGSEALYTKNSNNEIVALNEWSKILGKPTTVSGYGITDTFKSDLGGVTDMFTSFKEVGLGIWATATTNRLTDYGTVLDFNRKGTTWYHRLAFATTGDIFYYTGINTETLAYYGKLAFTSSTVAAATKLATTRTIWGQNFDGGANVTGNLGGSWFAINDVASNPFLKLLENSNAWYLQGYSNKLYLGSGTTYSLNIDNLGNVGVPGALTANRINTVSESHMSVGAYVDPASGIGAALKVNGGFAAGGNSYFTSGNVLINTLTDSGYKLDINGNTRVTGSLHLNSEGWLNLYNAANTSRISISHNSASSKLDIYNRTTSAYATIQTGNIISNALDVTGHISMYNDQTERFIRSNVFGGAIRLRGNSSAATDRGIRFGRVDNSLGWLSQMAINADTGNVMINTVTDAGHKLDVNGSGRYISELHLNSGLRISNADGAGVGISLFAESSTNPNYGLMFARTLYKGVHGAVNGDWATYFTMSPDAGRGWIFTNSPTTTGGNVASISNTGNITASGEITAYSASDIRLKTDIQQLTNSLDIINKLNPVSYRWNDVAKSLNPNKNDGEDYGLIAQELEKVLPNLVHDVYNTYKSIDYVKLVPFLVKGMQEQSSKIKALERRIEKLSK